MNTLKGKLEQSIAEALQCGECSTAAELTKAYAVLRSAEAKERTADNIEKTLAVFAGIGDGLNELSKQVNPAELAKMMGQQK